VPEDAPYWTHTLEGPDDMPAHIKASLLGSSLTLPVRDGAFAVGTWQGIYLCEHRDSGGPRTVTVTAFGEGRD
jgi:secondary thiamine-phosphate synthase enzyme